MLNPRFHKYIFLISGILVILGILILAGIFWQSGNIWSDWLNGPALSILNVTGAFLTAAFGFLGTLIDFKLPIKNAAGKVEQKITPIGYVAMIGVLFSFVFTTVAGLGKSHIDNLNTQKIISSQKITLNEVLRGIYKIERVDIDFSLRLPGAKGQTLDFIDFIEKSANDLNREQLASSLGLNNCGDLPLEGTCRIESVSPLFHQSSFRALPNQLKHSHWEIEFFKKNVTGFFKKNKNKFGNFDLSKAGLTMQFNTELNYCLEKDFQLCIDEDSFLVGSSRLWIDFKNTSLLSRGESIPLDPKGWFEDGSIKGITDLLGGRMSVSNALINRWNASSIDESHHASVEWITLRIGGWGTLCMDSEFFKKEKDKFGTVRWVVQFPETLDELAKQLGPLGKSYSC